MKHIPTLLLMASLFPCVSAMAQIKPINDGISNTILISEREGSYANQGGSKATAELGEPNVGGLPAKNTVWYRYVAPTEGRYIVEIIDNQGLRAELRFPGNPATTIPLQTFVDGTSNTLFPNTEKLSVDLDRGQTVYLVVDAAQPFSFSWRFVEVLNDHYRDAQTISGDGGTLISADRRATRSSVESNLGLAYPAVWFEWTAPSTAAYFMDLVGSRQWDGATFENFGIRVFESVNGVPGNVIATAAGSSLDNSTRVAVNATAGQVYYIACHSGQSVPDSSIWLSWYLQSSPGVLAWAQNEYRTSEADGSVNCRLFKLRGDGDGSVRFISETIDGTVPAIGGEDFQIPVEVLLALGTRSSQVPVTILPNATAESEEAFGLVLTNPTGGLAIADGTTNTILIGEETDNAGYSLSWNEVRVKEGQTAYVELRRQHASDRQVAVGWRVNSGTCRAGIDMPALSGTAYLVPGQLTTNIAVPVYQDRLFEGPEYFNVTLTDSPQLGTITDGTSNTIVVVEDDDFFVPLPGSYCGLLDTEGWGALIKCTVTGIGGASGTVDYRGATYRFTGSFDAYGQLVASFARNNRPSIGMRLRFAEGWARCAASLREPDGDWAEGYVRYLPYNAKTSPAPQAGKYTLFCEGIGGGSVPVPVAGTSFVGTDGSVRFIGRTVDDQTFTSSSRIAQSDPDGLISGECSFMIPLYGKTGNLYGNCDFGLGPQQPGVESTLGWLKPWRPKDAIYPALPFQSISCRAVPFTTPPTGQAVIPLTDGSVRFLNGGITLDGTSNTILISETNKVTFPNGNPQSCSITIDPKTGWFSGKIKPPGSTKLINFYGAIHQGGYGYGLGFFPGNQRAGEVVIADF
jgi:hypothetical protein